MRRKLRVLCEQVPDYRDPELVFQSLYAQSGSAFWLDSSMQAGFSGRFSFMGDASGPLARLAQADVTSGTVMVTAGAESTIVHGSFFDWLRADLAALQVECPEVPFDFTLGWVGYLGYELKAEVGGSRAHCADTPDSSLVFADRAIAFDHRDEMIHLLALTEDDEEGAAHEWLRGTRERLCALTADPALPTPATPDSLNELALRHSRARYVDLVSACQQAIRAGESYEVCLTNTVTGCGQIDAWGAYRVLRQNCPAPFAALLRCGELSVLSTSPERFLRVSSTGYAESKPIKGTRPRSADFTQDTALRNELASSEKDRAENLMIVDLIRNDFNHCAMPGTVRVPSLFAVESYSTVHQLVSTITAQLRPDVSAVDCVRACFPGGSMTGAPKLRTMEILDELEEGPRGVYSGALGYFSLSGAVDLSIVIRTLVVHGSQLSYGIGGAVTAPSHPEDEYAETVVKAKPLLSLLGIGFPEQEMQQT